MSEPIEVPEYMLNAAVKAADEDLNRWGDPVARLHAALAAALRAFTENPTVPSEEECERARDVGISIVGIMEGWRYLLVDFQRNLFRPKTPPLPPSFASIAADIASDSRIGGTPAQRKGLAEEWARKFYAAGQEAK